MQCEIDQRRGGIFDRRKTLVELARRKQALQKRFRHRRVCLMMPGETAQHLRLLQPMFVKLGRKFDDRGRRWCPRSKDSLHRTTCRAAHGREFMKLGAHIVETLETGLTLAGLGEIQDIDDVDRTSPSSFCCSRKELIQAPLRFERRAK
jgi:hypothetical protein